MKRLVSALFATVICLSSLFTLTSCERVRTKSWTEAYFDTKSIMSFYSYISNKRFDRAVEYVEGELQKYDKLFDFYFEYSGINNVKTINKNAGKSAVTVDPELFDFLVWCKEMFTLTDGVTNIAMGSVLKKWHDFRDSAPEFGMEAEDDLPGVEVLADAALHTDIDLLELNAEDLTVYISDSRCSLDVGAVAKGYATERIARGLVEMGYTSFALNIGGNLRCVGTRPGGDEWSVGITNPDKSSMEPFVTTVSVSDTSLVTSGNYERYVTKEGKSYHHLIDPATNFPATHFSSVTVIIPDSGLADALSTAFFCSCMEDAQALFDRLVTAYPDLKVVLVSTDYEEVVTLEK